MNEKRIATIIKEIEYWKEHNILPDQQCDFLLALYTNGGHGEQMNAEPEEKLSLQQSKVIKLIQTVLLLILLPFSFLVLYFTEFHSYLQLGILAFFLTYSAWMFIYYKQRGNTIYHLSMVVSLFLILLLTILTGNLFIYNPIMVNIIISLNFIFWFILGLFFRLKYLLITSISALLFVTLYLFL